MNREILSLALPSIVSNITVPLLGLCDVTIMGHIGGATSIAAIAVGSMIFNVVYWLFGFLRMGTSGITAQAFGGSLGGSLGGERWEVGGERLPSSQNKPLTTHPSPHTTTHPSPHTTTHPSPHTTTLTTSILRDSVLAALGFGLALVVFQVPLQWLTFWLMQVPTDVMPLCIHYYYICIWGAPAMLGLYALTGWFIGMQDTRTPMMIAIGQNVVNIALSLFLVVVLGLGIVGVAVGTLVSQWAAFLTALVAVRTRYGIRGAWEISATYLRDKWHLSWRKVALISRQARVYADIFLRTLCLVAVNLYFTSAGAAQGALTLAANTLLMQFFLFFSYVMDGFAYAGEALAGKSYGADNIPLLRRVVVSLFRWGVAVAMLFTVAYWLFGPQVLTLLTSDAAVVRAATTYLPWAVAIPLAGMAAFVWDGVFIGITATRGMLLSCFVAAVVFFALWMTLSPSMGNHALWLALTAYLALRGLMQTVLFKRAV